MTPTLERTAGTEHVRSRHLVAAHRMVGLRDHRFRPSVAFTDHKLSPFRSGSG